MYNEVCLIVKKTDTYLPNQEKEKINFAYILLVDTTGAKKVHDENKNLIKHNFFDLLFN